MRRYIEIFFYYHSSSFYHIDRRARLARNVKLDCSYLLREFVINDTFELLNIKLSMMRDRSIIVYTFYYKSNISVSSILSTSTIVAFIASTKSTTAIRYSRYRSVSPSFSHSTFAVLPSFVRNPLPYAIHRIIVLNSECEPSTSHRCCYALNYSTISIVTSFESSELSRKTFSNISIRLY